MIRGGNMSTVLDQQTSTLVLQRLDEIAVELFTKADQLKEEAATLKAAIHQQIAGFKQSSFLLRPFRFTACKLSIRRYKQLLKNERTARLGAADALLARRQFLFDCFGPAERVFNDHLGRLIEFRIKSSISLGAGTLSSSPEELEMMMLIKELKQVSAAPAELAAQSV